MGDSLSYVEGMYGSFSRERILFDIVNYSTYNVGKYA